MAGKDRRPSEVEADLWRRITSDVKPLNRSRAPAPDGTTDAAAPKPPAPRPAAPAPREAPAGTPELRHGETAGIDRRTAENLRRGKMSIEARLDLHGMTQLEAHRALTAFVAGQHDSGRRCVLVVTGKGREGGGVLRAMVPQWLNGAELRPRVLAFNYAQPRDGGDGALYVLLRRRRQ